LSVKNVVGVRTCSFTFAGGVLVSRTHVELHVTSNSTFARQPCLGEHVQFHVRTWSSSFTYARRTPRSSNSTFARQPCLGAHVQFHVCTWNLKKTSGLTNSLYKAPGRPFFKFQG